MDFRPVLYVIGILLSILAIAMTVPMLADLFVGSPDWKAFFICIMITAFFGGVLMLSNTGQTTTITRRQGFLLTSLSWLTLALFASLPIWFSDLGLNFTDAFFEAMSGITTTGATVIVGLDEAPPGILLWRAILQWLGGIGIIVMALSILPFLKVGGMQLFRTESSENEKALPRAASLASSIGVIYLFLTAACAICYSFAGLSTFHAIAHAMTTIATGGFSTFDTSFAHYDDPWVEIVAMIFMLLGGLPFVLYYKAIHGDPKSLLKDSQVHWFLCTVSIAVVSLALYLALVDGMLFSESIRRASFNVISVITGTGYANGDYNAWGGFAVATIFFLMVIGGCAGSTTCGIKIFRFQVLYEVAKIQIRHLLHPHGIFIPHYNGRPIPKDVPVSVMSFIFMYALCFVVLALLLSLTGLDFMTAISGATTSISNVGPGLGEIIGPAGNFSTLPDSAKWILMSGMLLGRLELFTVLVMLSPRFWSR